MKNLGIKVSLFINYFVFAALLNSVGILVQKSQNVYGVNELQAAQLEPFKDLSIAFTSFLIGSFLPRLGYKKGFLLSLGLVFLGCLGMYFGNSFWAVKILFACTGIAFATVKVSVLALIGVVVNDKKEHKSFMSIIESVFMIGIAFAYVVFPLFYSDEDPNAWLRVYLFLAALIFVVFLIVLFTKIEVPKAKASSVYDDIKAMLKLMTRPLILLFAFFAFLYVMVEQGIMSWLPSFNQKVLFLPEKLSVQMALILMLSIAFGRFISAYIVKRVNYLYYLLFCLGATVLLIVFALPQTQKIVPQSSLVGNELVVNYKGKQQVYTDFESFKNEFKQWGIGNLSSEQKELDGQSRKVYTLPAEFVAQKLESENNTQLYILPKEKAEEWESPHPDVKSVQTQTLIQRVNGDEAVVGLGDVPLIAFIFPLVGLFLAPLYPLVNSSVLSATEENLHSSMAGLLTFFSAIGGTLGSILVGFLFQEIGGAKAFYFAVVPIALVAVVLIAMNRNIAQK